MTLRDDPVAPHRPSRLERAAVWTSSALAFRLAKKPQRRLVEIAERCSLHSMREQTQQQPARQVGGHGPAQMVSPLEAKLFGAAIAKRGDRGVESPYPIRGRPMSAILPHVVRASMRHGHAALRALRTGIPPTLFDRREGAESTARAGAALATIR